MEAEDPLSQLRDIHLPEPVIFWPPAPGWWILLVLLLIGLVFAWRHAIAAMIQRRKLGSVIRELDRAYSKFSEESAFEDRLNQAGLEFLATVNILLKRVAQVSYPEAGTAHMTGSQWLRFLDNCDNTSDFTSGAGAPLADGIYRRSFDADAHTLYTLTKGWVENRYQSHVSPPRFGRTTA